MRARRVVAIVPRTILCLPSARRQPVLRVLRDERRARANVENDPVNVRSNRGLAVVHHDGERLRRLAQRFRPVQWRAEAAAHAGVLNGKWRIGPEARAGHRHRLRGNEPRAAEAAQQAAAADQWRHDSDGRQSRGSDLTRAQAPAVLAKPTEDRPRPDARYVASRAAWSSRA